MICKQCQRATTAATTATDNGLCWVCIVRRLRERTILLEKSQNRLTSLIIDSSAKKHKHIVALLRSLLGFVRDIQQVTFIESAAKLAEPAMEFEAAIEAVLEQDFGVVAGAEVTKKHGLGMQEKSVTKVDILDKLNGIIEVVERKAVAYKLNSQSTSEPARSYWQGNDVAARQILANLKALKKTLL